MGFGSNIIPAAPIKATAADTVDIFIKSKIAIITPDYFYFINISSSPILPIEYAIAFEPIVEAIKKVTAIIAPKGV